MVYKPGKNFPSSWKDYFFKKFSCVLINVKQLVLPGENKTGMLHLLISWYDTRLPWSLLTCQCEVAACEVGKENTQLASCEPYKPARGQNWKY